MQCEHVQLQALRITERLHGALYRTDVSDLSTRRRAFTRKLKAASYTPRVNPQRRMRIRLLQHRLQLGPGA